MSSLTKRLAAGTAAMPVTGANAALIGGIGAGVLVLGAVLFVIARRRRVVTVAE